MQTAYSMGKEDKSLNSRQHDPLKGSCQGAKDIGAWQKIVGLKTFSTATLKFCDS